MKLKKKHRPNLILIDVDGVILDWSESFHAWVQEQKHIRMNNTDESYWMEHNYQSMTREQADELVDAFNTSDAMSKLMPLRDAVEYVRKLHFDDGYRFHCITSVGDSQETIAWRQYNLDTLFGKGVFEKVLCLPLGSDKDDALREYAGTGCYWIEDKLSNAVAGLQHGLSPLLMNHVYNIRTNHPDIPRVYNWKEIYQRIIK